MPEEDQNQLEATQALAMLLRELAVGERATVGEAAAVEAVIEAWNKLPTSLRPADPEEAALLRVGIKLAEELEDTHALRDLHRRMGRLLLARGQWQAATMHLDHGVTLVRAFYTEECKRISAHTAQQFESELHEVREIRLAGRHRELAQLHRRISENTSRLERAVADVRALSRLLPICSSCHRIRDDQGFWSEVHEYIRQHSEADIQFDQCPSCKAKSDAIAGGDLEEDAHE